MAKRGTSAAGAGGRICVKTDARQSWGKRNFFAYADKTGDALTAALE